MSGEGLPKLPPFEFAPANPTDCGRHVLSTASPVVLESLGQGIEQRYLGDVMDPVQVSPRLVTCQTITDHVHSLATSYEYTAPKAAAEPVENSTSPPTLDARFLPLLDRAAKLGVLEDVPSFHDPQSRAVQWEIINQRQDDPSSSPLFFLYENTPGAARIRAVDLDSLYRKEPEFLRRWLLQYHTLEEERRWRGMANHFASSHQLAAADVISGIFMELASLPSDEQLRSLSDIKSFTSHLAGLELLHHGEFSERLFKVQKWLGRSGLNMDSHDALAHMAKCPTQPEEVRSRAGAMRDFITKLLVLHPPMPGGNAGNEVSRQLMQVPHLLLPSYLDSFEASKRDEIVDAQMRANFIGNDLPNTDHRTLLENLEVFWPEAYAAYSEFADALDAEDSGGRRTEYILTGTVDSLRRASLEEFLSSTKIIQHLQVVLHRHLGHEPLPPGAKANADGTVEIVSEPLRTVLTLLICKRARARIAWEDHAGLRVTDPDGPMTDESAADYQGVEESLKTGYIRAAQQEVALLDALRETITEVRRHNGITDEDIAWLSQIPDSKGERHASIDEDLFATVFHALLLERWGMVSMLDRGFRRFLAEFLKEDDTVLPEREEKLRQLGLL